MKQFSQNEVGKASTWNSQST